MKLWADLACPSCEKRDSRADVSPPKQKAPKFPCPHCGGPTCVYRSIGVHRMRRCVDCQHRFRTREISLSQKSATSSALRNSA